INKNRYLRQCLALYQFIESYENVGYNMIIEETAEDLDENYIKELYSMLAIQYLIFRSKIGGIADEERTIGSFKTETSLEPKFDTEFKQYQSDDYNVYDSRYHRLVPVSKLGERKKLSASELEIRTAIDVALAAEDAAEKKRIAARKAAEEEARRIAEEAARIAAEEEARRIAEEKARAAAEEAARIAAEEEARRIAEEEARRLAEEAARKIAEEAARKAAEEEVRRIAQENARKAAEEAARIAAEEEARRIAEEEARRLAEEAARIAAEEATRKAARKAAEEETRKAVEEATREAARIIAEEEARRAAELRALRAQKYAHRKSDLAKAVHKTAESQAVIEARKQEALLTGNMGRKRKKQVKKAMQTDFTKKKGR
ncbi:MAG: hypothetical protein PHW77_02600, partial [Eubacteriales bacterium]|nr:hypothetical protein [Eubacteriales bacterium]